MTEAGTSGVMSAVITKSTTPRPSRPPRRARHHVSSGRIRSRWRVALGVAHLDGAGLLWRISGGKIIAMYADWAVIEINGEQHIVHRRPSPTSFVLPWRARVAARKLDSIDRETAEAVVTKSFPIDYR
jgi:hypothetical protein